jgi:hypothetical protein
MLSALDKNVSSFQFSEHLGKSCWHEHTENPNLLEKYLGVDFKPAEIVDIYSLLFHY